MIALCPFVPRFNENYPMVSNLVLNLMESLTKMFSEKLRIRFMKYQSKPSTPRGVIPIGDDTRIEIGF